MGKFYIISPFLWLYATGIISQKKERNKFKAVNDGNQKSAE